jgi:Caspase domain
MRIEDDMLGAKTLKHWPIAALATLAVLAGGQEVQAQKVHAVLVGDTDSNLGEGVVENLKKMNNLLTSIHRIGKIQVSRSEIRDGSFRCTNIRSAVERLMVNPDDAVIFYYAGHGFRRDSTQTKFPEFDCQRSRGDRALDMNAITKVLIGKQPRFVLALADACNQKTRSETKDIAAAPLGSDEDRKAGLRRLFLSYKGRLTMSAAIPGEFAWYMTEGPLLGGFFTNQFLSVLNHRIAADAESVRWENVAEQAGKRIIISNDPRPPLQQDPQYEAELVALSAR